MRRATGLSLSILLLAGCSVAESHDEAAQLLTVELFSPHRVISVTMTPLGQRETVKVCTGCRVKAQRKALTATARGDAVDVGMGMGSADE